MKDKEHAERKVHMCRILFIKNKHIMGMLINQLYIQTTLLTDDITT